MRTKRILKAFCLSAALLSIGLTASRAMATCAGLFANSMYCIGEVSSASASAISKPTLAGPVSGGGQLGVCTVNSASDPCVTSAGVTTFNFADGSSATANFTGTVGASGGCVPVSPANTATGCPSTPLIAGGTIPFNYSSSQDKNANCTGKGKPDKCCTGADAGTCLGDICIIANSESCPSGASCLTLNTFLSGKTPGVCPAGGTCEFASDVASAGQGIYTYSTGAGGATTEISGCSQQVQFTANKALNHFAYVGEGPLTGSCPLAGASLNIRCQGNIQ